MSALLSQPWFWPLVALVVGYGLGSIPFGLILTRLAGAGDIRAIGSGNIGATNVLRTGRKGLAAATLILDAVKGIAAVLLFAWLLPGTEIWAAFGAFLGHLYPVWLGFKGGKGVATLAGLTLALSWPVGLVFAMFWLLSLYILRYSSVAGMLAAVAAPITAAVLEQWSLVWVFLAFALLVLWKHRANIDRLLNGTEPRVGAKRG